MKRIHDFYICETEIDEVPGYRVKRVNRERELISEDFVFLEDFIWFSDKDYVIVDKEEFNSIT